MSGEVLAETCRSTARVQRCLTDCQDWPNWLSSQDDIRQLHQTASLTISPEVAINVAHLSSLV